ncbi:MAG: hypothetical protein WAO58_11045 [Fimbriimonadaceae bacterium]
MAILVPIMIFLLVGFSLFVYELLMPGFAFVVYLMIRGMVGRAINDRHHCFDRAGLSMLWGAIWATLYTAPIIATVYAFNWWLLSVARG